MVPSITRRQFLKASTAGSLSLASLGCSELTPALSSAASDRPQAGDYRIYFGDLHNHNEVGYARGSLERAYEIAQEHLDFFAFTPHGYWHDIGHYENNIEKKWLDGFEVTKKRWPEVLQMVRKYDQPGRFVTIPGFEWHSTSLGDYHILFPTLEGEYVRFDDLRQFQRFAKQRHAIMALSMTVPPLPTFGTPKAAAGLKTRSIIFLNRVIDSVSLPVRMTTLVFPVPTVKGSRPCLLPN